MGRLTGTLVVVILLAVLAGGLFLALWNPPPPLRPIEKVIPNARFAK